MSASTLRKQLFFSAVLEHRRKHGGASSVAMLLNVMFNRSETTLGSDDAVFSKKCVNTWVDVAFKNYGKGVGREVESVKREVDILPDGLRQVVRSMRRESRLERLQLLGSDAASRSHKFLGDMVLYFR